MNVMGKLLIANVLFEVQQVQFSFFDLLIDLSIPTAFLFLFCQFTLTHTHTHAITLSLDSICSRSYRKAIISRVIKIRGIFKTKRFELSPYISFSQSPSP